MLDSTTLTTTADITRKTVHGQFTAADKVYDGDVGDDQRQVVDRS